MATNLNNLKCTPCSGKTPKLSYDEISINFKKLSNWSINDEKKLYIADTGENIKCMYVFDVEGDLISNQKLVYDFKPFFSDGFRCDKDGNIWTSAGKAIKCFNPQNELIGQLILPELVSNLEFGGKEGNTLYVTATSSLYAMELNQIGAKFPI